MLYNKKKKHGTKVTFKNVVLVHVGTDRSLEQAQSRSRRMYMFGLQYNFVITNLKHLDWYEENKNYQ